MLFLCNMCNALRKHFFVAWIEILLKTVGRLKQEIFFLPQQYLNLYNFEHSREVDIDFVLNIIETCNEEENYFSEDS